MKKILEIFKNDVKKILKSPMAIIIILGIMIIPGIYAWLNIDSNWGPYDNTGNLPIAVVNKDKGTNLLGENINVGNEIENSLKNNDGMKWIFTDENEAKTKVEEGKYYGCIIIPEGFSENITTILDNGNIQKPQFDFYLNDKKNPIAPIIVNKAIGTVQTSVNQAFVNKVIFKVVDKAENINIADTTDIKTNEIIEKLNNAKIKVKELRTIVQTTTLASDSLKNSLSAVKELLPKITDISTATKEDIDTIKNTTKSFANSLATLKNDITSAIDESENNIKELLNLINEVDLSNLETKKEQLNNKLDNSLTILKRLTSNLSSLNEITKLTKVTIIDNKVKEQITKLETIKNNLNIASLTIEGLNEIKEKNKESYNEIVSLKEEYTKNLKEEIENLYQQTSQSIDNASNLFINFNTSLKNVDASMKYLINSLNNGGKLSENIDTILESFEKDIDKLIILIQEVKGNAILNDILKILKNKPNELADFITSPIDTNQKVMYQIDTYGSKMAPFYSILACWVGCTVLTAILKINVKEDKITKDAKNYQKFFGRFILFGILAMTQGLVIGLGDIFLQVQTINPILFLLTLMLSSLIFVLIIYSLAFTFGKVGQALAIVIMVLQVAGSGGTFPIELLPRAFQLLQPYMPFYPAMNAVRETIGGFHNNDYIIYILILLCHIIIPLLLGLVLSKTTKKIKIKLEEELEETDVIG